MFEHGYALLIGVDENQDKKNALPIVKKDIAALKAVLTHPERCGYREENVRVLTGTNATHANILNGLDWLCAKLKSERDESQTIFIYYSGHGDRDGSGDSYLIPYDSVSQGGLAAKDFADRIERIQPRRLLVVLDCCHAEAMNVKGAAERKIKSVAITPDTKELKQLVEGDGRAVLSSCRPNELSWMREDGKMSVFTYHLVEALTGHTGRPAWPDVTVTEVMEYVGRTVPRTAQSLDETQVPYWRYQGTAFPIALVLGGKGVGEGDRAPSPLLELPPKVESLLEVDEVEGTVRGVKLRKVKRGQVEAKAAIKAVKQGGSFTGVEIDELG